MRKIILILVGLGFLLPTAYIRAQSVDPGAIRERGSETQEYYRLEERLRERKIPEKGRIKDRTEEAAKPEPETAEQTIFISRIDAGPSAILSADEIRDITGGYEGKNVSIRDLFDVVRRINELYARKSVAARAVLPPQKVEKGVVRIDLIEGRVGEITVENNRYTRDSFFTKRTSLKTGDIVKLDTLEKDLLFLNSTSDVDIRAELRPGGALGTTDCILKVREPENYQAALFSDNAGNDTVGLYRFGLMLGSKSLLGYRDSLLINSFFTAKGGTVAGSAAYSFPAGTLGTRLGLSYDYNQIEVISGPYKVLDISGESSDLGLELSHPLLVKPDFRLNGLAGFHAKKSATDFDGERLSSTRVRTINAGIDALSLDAGGYWYTRHRFTQGLHVSGGDVEYLAYNPLLLRQQILGRDVVLLLRARAQLTRKKLLPPSEQFQIGGASSVRGYPEGFLIGDKGYLVNVELSFPLPSSENGVFTADIANRLKGIAFIDHGGAFPYKPGGGSMTHRDYITGAGVGLAVNVSKFLTGRVSLGIPITNRGSLEDKYVFHFYIQSDLF
ncbi:MAG: ShlB/FhaC/HecB family hemolysin secretion/activation protein [Bacteriovoracaceae bacterium]|nr:ShlB/FhaC/HecB family hemolysin secretion/activation protein [Bacteriovoracaceae bacterium]HOS26867.1 ShlB/FhaC/HecB family hemolysin secretion/activation protein [Deltaproteobacteria bacterium]HPX50045.1 ShlB/FhaC/HecB family hemolysin secretion/activation protein [Deltaproteobacteria bacterium]HQA72125.1 ShlB/FhaC/HecB family hemolysin secretion/activation protein [Deltaproteobacteria bacterium]